MITAKMFGVVFTVMLLHFSSVTSQICNTTEKFCQVVDAGTVGSFELPKSSYGAGSSFQLEIELADNTATAQFDLLCVPSGKIEISLSETTATAVFETEELASRSVAALDASQIVVIQVTRESGNVIITRTDQAEEPLLVFEDKCSDFATTNTVSDLDGLAVSGSAKYYYYKDPCYYKPCYNGGICRSEYGYNYYCLCVDHSKGINCEEGPEVLTTVSVCPGCFTDLKCSSDDYYSGLPSIFIKSAIYGRADVEEQALAQKRGCGYPGDFDCAEDVTPQAQAYCNGQYECRLTANQYKPTYSSCKGPQYLTVKYLCARKKIGPENAGAWMGCPPNKVMKVFKATWDCNYANRYNQCCTPISTRREIKAKCDHHPSCDPSIHRNDFAHPCTAYLPLGSLQMDILYGCIKKKPVKIPNQPIFVLNSLN